jgi:hypothetical protein
VKLKAGVTRDQREFVINGLKNFIKHNRVLVSDTAELVGATVLATQLLMLFFYVGMGNSHPPPSMFLFLVVADRLCTVFGYSDGHRDAPVLLRPLDFVHQ